MKKVILVTGSSNGFGRLACQSLALKGHDVFASMRKPHEKNKIVKESLQSFSQNNGVNINVIDIDVTDDASVTSGIQRMIEEKGRIDVLINNAGTMSSGVTEAFTSKQVIDQFDVNVFGCVRMIRSILPHMRKQKSGLIIQLSSLAGRAVFPFFGVYCASKYAIEAIAESYRYELRPFGIDSVIIEPGPFKTNLISSAPRPEDKEVMSFYGDMAQIPEQILSGFESMFEDTANYPSPQLVVDTIDDIINMDINNRPLRTVVAGNDFGISEINNAVAPIQKGLLEAMGLGHLAL